MRTRQKSGIGRYTPFLLHPTNLLRDVPPLPPPFPPLHPIDQVVSIVVAGRIMSRKYRVRKKKKRDHYMQPQRRRTPTNSNALLPQPCANIETVLYTGVGQAGCGGGSIGRVPRCRLCARDDQQGIPYICRRRDSSTGMWLCCGPRVDRSQARHQRDCPLPKGRSCSQPTTPRTIVVSVVPDTLHIASIALALFRSSSTPSNPVCRSLSKIICIPSLLLPS